MDPRRWLDWLRGRDRSLLALRRAGRTAIIMPALFAIGVKEIDNPTIATFAAFGSFAMLLLVDFGGRLRDRIQAQLALVAVGAVFVCIGTLVSQTPWLAALVMAAVGFGVLFAGVVSSALAGATTSLLLSLILPIATPGPASSIPDRVYGWVLAGAVAVAAISLLWPAPVVDPLRPQAAVACRALAVRLRTDASYFLGGPDAATLDDRAAAAVSATAAVETLRTKFLAVPYRPTGLSTAARTVVRLVDELGWLDAIARQSPAERDPLKANQPSCAVKIAGAEVLERGAELLDSIDCPPEPLREALDGLRASLDAMEQAATDDLPVHRMRDDPDREFLSALEPTFRAQELSFAVAQIGFNIDLAGAAERRAWWERLLGRQPAGLASQRQAAQERAVAHVERHSVWLHNSVRAAVGLGLAVYIADRAGVQHSFWVVLGTLSVLRSNALNTGQNIVRGIIGTVVGFVVGSALIELVGTNTTVLWFLLPVAILIAGVAPAAISFAAGQAAFTLTLVILFNIIAPTGWHVGLLRVEDIALGCAVSLVVGLLFWPRGAGAALGRALAEAYTDSAAYLARAVEFGVERCDAGLPTVAVPTQEAIRAAGAARRLDDTFREYLAERGTKSLPLAEVTTLVTGVAGLRLAGDAVLDLWQRQDGVPSGDRAAARTELLAASERVSRWYDELATSLVDGHPIASVQEHDFAADTRLLEAVRRDLRAEDGQASATAVRVIWTGDHLDAARRLQETLVGPAGAATQQGALTHLADVLPLGLRLRITGRRAAASSQ